jgi:hypothetical protein
MVADMVDWFERLTGFSESAGYARTRAQLGVTDEGRLTPSAQEPGYRVGAFSMPSLAELRAAARGQVTAPHGRPTVRIVRGDVGALHAEPAYRGALFQVASQFNCLEMVHPTVRPEDGVASYAHDHTQGPSCAVATGAATIYRNYLVPVGANHLPAALADGAATGQTADRQLDALADLGPELAHRTGRPVRELWDQSNGYALVTQRGLAAIGAHLAELDHTERDTLLGLLRIGVHTDTEVTLAQAARGQLVSQAFCSALPIAYCPASGTGWEPFARLILDAAYEATLLTGVLGAARGASDIVALTLLGGGVFANPQVWILAALARALACVPYALDVRIVSFSPPSPALEALVERLPDVVASRYQSPDPHG